MAVVLTLLGFLILLGAPALYLWSQWRAMTVWSGALQVAAAVPLIGWGYWIVQFSLDISRDPTAHNLFPFEIAIGSALSLAWLAALYAIRWVIGLSAAPR